MNEDEPDRLADYLSRERGEPTTILDVRRLSVGHSRAMHRVETDGGTFVVRVEQGGVFGSSSGEEFGFMRGLADAGYPVAPALWYEPTGEVLGQPFFVMDFVEGDEHGRRAGDGRVDGGRFRARAGRAPRRRLGGRRDPARRSCPGSPSEATHLQIERWADIYRSAAPAPIPLLEESAAWLHRHAPPLERVSIVHGDAGPGNVVQANGKIVAVTDWEFAHLGDPAEDWSFCLAMRGARTMPRETWLALFDRVAGVRLDEATWTYWEAFNLFKGACANTTCLAVFENGANRAPNMAIIGTVLHRSFLRRLVDLVVPS